MDKLNKLKLNKPRVLAYTDTVHQYHTLYVSLKHQYRIYNIHAPSVGCNISIKKVISLFIIICTTINLFMNVHHTRVRCVTCYRYRYPGTTTDYSSGTTYHTCTTYHHTFMMYTHACVCTFTNCTFYVHYQYYMQYWGEEPLKLWIRLIILPNPDQHLRSAAGNRNDHAIDHEYMLYVICYVCTCMICMYKIGIDYIHECTSMMYVCGMYILHTYRYSIKNITYITCMSCMYRRCTYCH